MSRYSFGSGCHLARIDESLRKYSLVCPLGCSLDLRVSWSTRLFNWIRVDLDALLFPCRRPHPLSIVSSWTERERSQVVSLLDTAEQHTFGHSAAIGSTDLAAISPDESQTIHRTGPIGGRSSIDFHLLCSVLWKQNKNIMLRVSKSRRNKAPKLLSRLERKERNSDRRM